MLPHARCSLRAGQIVLTGTVHLGPAALTFQGATPLTLKLAEIRTIEVRADGALLLGHATGDVVLDLEDRALAEAWAARLRRSPHHPTG